MAQNSRVLSEGFGIGDTVTEKKTMDAATNEVEPLLDPKDVKLVLRCSLPLIYKLAASGRLPAVRIPCPGSGTKRQRNLIRFKKGDVLDFVQKHYTGATT